MQDMAYMRDLKDKLEYIRQLCKSLDYNIEAVN